MQPHVRNSSRANLIAIGGAATFACLLEVSFALASGQRLDAGYALAVSIAFIALYTAYVVFLYVSATGTAELASTAEAGLGLAFIAVAVVLTTLALRQHRSERRQS